MQYMTILLHQCIHFLYKSKSFQQIHCPTRLYLQITALTHHINKDSVILVTYTTRKCEHILLYGIYVYSFSFNNHLVQGLIWSWNVLISSQQFSDSLESCSQLLQDFGGDIHARSTDPLTPSLVLLPLSSVVSLLVFSSQLSLSQPSVCLFGFVHLTVLL